MKNFWKLLCLPLLLVACEHEENLSPEPKIQEITLNFTSPERGGSYDPAETVLFTADGAVNFGEITRVRLSIENEIIPSVKQLPFTYAHQFGPNQTGVVSIRLQVEADQGATAVSDFSITLQKPKDPEPDQPENPEPEVPTLPSQTPEGYPLWIVAQDGSGHYTKVQAAINASPADNKTRVIFVKSGTYKEKLTIPSGHNHLILVGEDPLTTIITYDDYAGKKNEDGSELGTQNSASVAVKSTDFMAVNITFQNTYVNYAGKSGTQAVAYRQDADRASFYHCRFVGYQDTLYLKNASRCYFQECYIEGNVDFIFGDAVAYFDHCQLHCNRNESVLTAAATLEGSKFGFVFESCEITHIEGADFNGKEFTLFHLGRPWQNKPKTVFLRCNEPAKLDPAAWRSMSVEADLYAEYKCTGEGATADRLACREMGGRQLSDSEALAYTVENIFASTTHPEKYASSWIPEAKYEWSMTR